jgi:hypothetical protein
VALVKTARQVRCPVRIGFLEMPTVINEERIIPGVNSLAPEPRNYPEAHVRVVIIVAKVIVAIPRKNEQV